MHVHFVAIAGTGMGSLAGLLKERGHEVTGSDEAVYPPMSTALERWGIPVAEGFRAEHVEERRPDLVVIGNAVRPENAEARAALQGGMRCLSFPDALYEHAMQGRHPVVVTGTHGKTTTSGLIATLLHETGQDPSFLVGGILANFDGSFRDGGGEAFVVEGDEYDTAFFDKTPKFLHYHPRTLVLTSVEFDHADIYRDLEHVKSAFRTLVERMPTDGVIVAATAEPNVAGVVEGAPCRVVGYAVAPGAAEWCASDLDPGPAGTVFSVRGGDASPVRVLTPMHGRHNVSNSLAALVVSTELGVPLEEAASALERFRGVKRRMELRGEVRGVTVMDDFAHHPTAVRETLAGLRARHPERRIVAVFEPRSNTTRRTVFQRDYAQAFGAADRVLVAVVPETPIYSATGEVAEFFSAEQLARDLRDAGKDAAALDGVDALVDALVADAREGDVIITLSNGGFGGIWDRLLDQLRGRT
jgi:UDP-N-acetylmuramate: L-alanyl-gamma-D-glutamyl-meso-diaminopimelate ligase